MGNKRNAFEVAFWPCSEEYVKNPSMIQPAFETLTRSGGPSGLEEIFYGVEVGKSNAWAVLNWDSMEAHGRFLADQEALLEFTKMFESSAEDGIPKGTLIHASWDERAVPCLQAPFVELTKITPKPGITKEAMQEALDRYVAYMNDPKSGAVGATYGHVVEEPEQFIIVVGWKTLEVRYISCIASRSN